MIDSECGGDIGPESHDIERPQLPDRQNRHRDGQDQREHQQIGVDRAEGGEEPVLKDEEVIGIQEPLDEGGPRAQEGSQHDAQQYQSGHRAPGTEHGPHERRGHTDHHQKCQDESPQVWQRGESRRPQHEKKNHLQQGVERIQTENGGREDPVAGDCLEHDGGHAAGPSHTQHRPEGGQPVGQDQERVEGVDDQEDAAGHQHQEQDDHQAEDGTPVLPATTSGQHVSHVPLLAG